VSISRILYALMGGGVVRNLSASRGKSLTVLDAKRRGLEINRTSQGGCLGSLLPHIRLRGSGKCPITDLHATVDSSERLLLNASRLAGMAEVDTSVLHNVGNVLRSVNVSVTLLSEQGRGSKLVNLSRAAALIRQHANDMGTFVTQDSQGQASLNNSRALTICR